MKHEEEENESGHHYHHLAHTDAQNVAATAVAARGVGGGLGAATYAMGMLWAGEEGRKSSLIAITQWCSLRGRRGLVLYENVRDKGL